MNRAWPTILRGGKERGVPSISLHRTGRRIFVPLILMGRRRQRKATQGVLTTRHFVSSAGVLPQCCWIPATEVAGLALLWMRSAVPQV